MTPIVRLALLLVASIWLAVATPAFADKCGRYSPELRERIALIVPAQYVALAWFDADPDDGRE